MEVSWNSFDERGVGEEETNTRSPFSREEKLEVLVRESSRVGDPSERTM